MFWDIPPAGCEDEHPDSTSTVDLPMLAGTIPHPIITDEAIAGRTTQTLKFDDWSDGVVDQPMRHHAAHRRVRPATLSPRTVLRIGAVIAAVSFGVWLSTGASEPRPAVFRPAAPDAPDASVAPSPQKTKPKPTRSAVRPAEPVVLQSARPTRTAAPVPTVTVTATPRPAVTPTPEPTSSPRPTPTTQAPDPSDTPDVSMTPFAPEATNPPPPAEGADHRHGGAR
jgi:hypothetical protein